MAGDANFSKGGLVSFQVASSTPVVKVSGTANLDGSIVVDVSFLPKDSNITLMVFNDSTGRFKLLKINDQYCSKQLIYLPQALVLDTSVECPGNEGSTVQYFWVLWVTLIAVASAIIIGLVIHFKKPKKSVESKIDDLAYPDDNAYQALDEE